MEKAKAGRRCRCRMAGDRGAGLWPAALLAAAVLAGAALATACGGDGGAGGEGAESGAGGGEAGGADAAAGGAEVQSPAVAPAGAEPGDSGVADPVGGGETNPVEGAGALPGGAGAVEDAAVAVDATGADTLAGLGSPTRVPAGTRIRVTVDEEISTDLYRPGDAVVATVSEDVTDPAGDVLIPRGVKLLGRILTSEGSPGVDEPPILEMAFETLSALNAEWPVEGAVINVPVVVDSRAGIARRFQRGRSGDREVPGRIPEGAVVVVELRADVRVGPIVGPEAFPEDTVPGRDAAPRR